MEPIFVLSTPKALSRNAAERLRQQWEQAMAGWENSHRLIVLEEGSTLTRISSSPSVPSAFCRYCAVANLTSSIWCAACGAPMLQEGR